MRALPQLCSEGRFKIFTRGCRARGWKRQRGGRGPLPASTLSSPHASALGDLSSLRTPKRIPASGPLHLLSLQPRALSRSVASAPFRSELRNPGPGQPCPSALHLITQPTLPQSPSPNPKAVTDVPPLCPDWQHLHWRTEPDSCSLSPEHRELTLAMNGPSTRIC